MGGIGLTGEGSRLATFSQLTALQRFKAVLATILV